MRISKNSLRFLLPFFLMATLVISCGDDNEIIPEEQPLTDADGNEYATVIIGNQEWITENLKVTRLNDDTLIPEVEDDNNWGGQQTPGFCWYDNNESENKSVYGPLYNWHTVATGKLCPGGWHVPTAGEWDELFDFLGDSAASKLKEAGNAHWSSANTDATNSTEFTALPGGLRESGNGFRDKGSYGYWWTATLDPLDNSRAMAREMNKFSRDGSELVFPKTYGLSVRCIKD